MTLTLCKENWEYIKSILDESDDGEECDSFVVVEVGQWNDEGKYAYHEMVFQDLSTSKCWRYYESRSGSYFTDYYYTEVEFCDVHEVEQVEVVTKIWKATPKCSG